MMLLLSDLQSRFRGKYPSPFCVLHDSVRNEGKLCKDLFNPSVVMAMVGYHIICWDKGSLKSILLHNGHTAWDQVLLGHGIL